MLIDDVEAAIARTPGLTATQIARKLYGNNGYGERVRAVCQILHMLGRIERTGKGGPGDPYRFYPASGTAASNSLPGRESQSSFGDALPDARSSPAERNLEPPNSSPVE